MFTIRIGTNDDIDRIARVVNAAFEIERPMRMRSERSSAQNVRELMERGDIFFIAEQEGRMVGAVFVRITGTTGYFGMLAVDPRLSAAESGALCASMPKVMPKSAVAPR